MSDVLYPLPDGYTLRPTTLADAEAVANVYNQAIQARGVPESVTPEDLHAGWSRPTFDIASSSRVVVNGAGDVMAIVTIWDNYDNPISPYVTWDVLPVPERRAIGLALLAWVDERAKQAVDRCPPDVRVSWRTTILANDAPYTELMDAVGLEPVRYFNYMRLVMSAEPDVTPLPDGISLRPYRHPDALQQVLEAKDEAFRDHYGHIERPIDERLKGFQSWIDNTRRFDPSLWLLAVDDASGEIAGLVLTSLEDNENPADSQISFVATRRAYRGRGIATNLLRRSFRDLWRRGQRSVVLYVDDASPTGANRLYESVGMRVERQEARYEKELRPGVELRNRA